MRRFALGTLTAVCLAAVAAYTVPLGFAQEEGKATRIHLVEHNGYFAARETLMDLAPGQYVFEVKNEAGKLVGFQLQDLKSQDTLAMGMVKKGETKEFSAEIKGNGFRYRCPINPTPWYEVSLK
jgi:hypothetical protein